MLNQIIDEYKGKVFAVTSIGLDGEKTDNITFKPKPRIKVYPKTIIATANDCLKECYFDYDLLKKTNIRTPLGEIMIIKVLSTGLALIAGPSTINDMLLLKEMLKEYKVEKIFIDGALFRKSIASFKVADATILATGASYNKNINKVVKDTSLILEELTLPSIDSKIAKILNNEQNTLVMDELLNKTIIDFKTVLNNEEEVKKYLNINSRYLYLNGALSKKLVQMIIDKRFELKNLTIIVKDATHIVVDAEYLEKLKLTKVLLKVINKINVLLLTYNPHSSLGYDFDNDEFLNKLQQNIEFPILNVIKDLE